MDKKVGNYCNLTGYILEEHFLGPFHVLRTRCTNLDSGHHNRTTQWHEATSDFRPQAADPVLLHDLAGR